MVGKLSGHLAELIAKILILVVVAGAFGSCSLVLDRVHIAIIVFAARQYYR